MTVYREWSHEMAAMPLDEGQTVPQTVLFFPCRGRGQGMYTAIIQSPWIFKQLGLFALGDHLLCESTSTSMKSHAYADMKEIAIMSIFFITSQGNSIYGHALAYCLSLYRNCQFELAKYIFLFLHRYTMSLDSYQVGNTRRGDFVS